MYVILVMLVYLVILMHNWEVGIACGALVRLGAKVGGDSQRRGSIDLATRGTV